MIQSVLQVLSGELNNFLELQTEPVERPLVIMSALARQDGSPAIVAENRVVCTLFNIEQERTALNAPSGNKLFRSNNPVHLNLYVLFSAYFAPRNYPQALAAISATIAFFQSKSTFTHQDTPELPFNVSKIIVEMVSLDITELNNLWSVLGAKHLPSVLFRIKMVSVSTGTLIEEFARISTIESQSDTE